MKRFVTYIASCILICSCSMPTSKSNHTLSTITPIPSGIDIDNLSDATVPAAFSSNDINWQDGTISLRIFNEDRYDASEIRNLTPGDTLAFGGSGIIVDSIGISGDMVRINGGIYNGGANLVAADSDTYRGCIHDDHSTYSLVGHTTLKLADNIMLADSADIDNPTSIKSDKLKDYLNDNEDNSDFYCLNTKVIITNGEVTKIIRRFIP